VLPALANQYMANDIFEKLGEVNKKIKQRGIKSTHKQYCYGNFLPSPSTKVMFIAEMPALDSQWCPRCNFDISWTDRVFQKFMIQYGFGGSYITDVVKDCDHSRRPEEPEINKYRELLLREIEIVNPQLIVALGESAFSMLRDRFTLGDRLYKDYLYHPSVWRYPNMRPEYIRRIEALADHCKSL
jgi:uracil-DNA glycosylase family 4